MSKECETEMNGPTEGMTFEEFWARNVKKTARSKASMRDRGALRDADLPDAVSSILGVKPEKVRAARKQAKTK